LAAENERRATLHSDGSKSALFILSCAYWDIAGVVITAADLSTTIIDNVLFQYLQNSSLRRSIVATPNRYGNGNLVHIYGGSDVLMEDDELYSFAKRGVWVTDNAARIVMRRIYINSRGLADLPGQPSDDPVRGDDGLEFNPGSSGALIENCISEGQLRGYRMYDSLPASSTPYRVLGTISLDDTDGFSTMSSNVEHQDVLAVGARNRGFVLHGASAEQSVGVTVTRSLSAWVAEGAPDDGGLQGAAYVTNGLFYNNTSTGVSTDSALADWGVTFTNSVGNGADYQLTPDEPFGDKAGRAQDSLSLVTTKLGTAQEPCVVYIPAGSNMKGAGKDGADIGANIIYRYQDGVATTTKLWDQTTGRFPCGAIVPGVNDVPGASCFDVHERLFVGRDGCSIP
jgi:hypothetical protein